MSNFCLLIPFFVQNMCFFSSVVQKNLEVGEVLAVDVSSIVALSSTVNVQVKYNGPMRRVVFGVCFHMFVSFDSSSSFILFVSLLLFVKFVNLYF